MHTCTTRSNATDLWSLPQSITRCAWLLERQPIVWDRACTLDLCYRSVELTQTPWPDVCTLDLCYRSVELTQIPWPDVCTLDLCYRSVELTQTPWPDVHNCCKSRPVWTSLTSTVAAPSTLSSKKYVVGYKLRSFLSQFVGATCWSNLVKIKSKMNMMTILHIFFLRSCFILWRFMC